MKHYFELAFMLVLFFMGTACQNEGESNIAKFKSNTESGNKVIDYSKVILKIERGAFHYDTFIVDQEAVRFLPKEERTGTNKADLKYYTASTTKISKEDFKELIDFVLINDFLRMENYYEDLSSCQSDLKISLTIGDKVKIIHCSDFQRGCPDLIYQIENKVIDLHGKQLQRKFLPG
ncbi:MAG: hypothetical protein R2799_16175 [Crocinitomicaceae bacterium]|nr:hypothetical protein [Crocinitomicaceae bacterium]